MTSETELLKEKIKIFDLTNTFLGNPNKFEFYKKLRSEYRRTGKVTKKVHTIRLFLINGDGCIFLVRRSDLKKENKWLFDKTLSTHVRKDETPKYTVLRESSEELEFPAIVLDQEDFEIAVKENDLLLFGATKEIETIENFRALYRYRDESDAIFPQITTIFFGVYNGPIRFEDHETDLIELFDLDELLMELKKNPEKYTEDLKVLVSKYEKQLRELISFVRKYGKKPQ